MNQRFALLVATSLLAGCSRTSEGNKPLPDAAPVAASASTPVPAGSIALVQTDAGSSLIDVKSDVKSRSDPRYKGLPLFEKLAVERGDRPAGALHGDDLYDALKAQGINVSNRRQVLALLVGAGYCQKADVDPDIDLTVCEYDDEAAMTKGKQEIMKVTYPNREVLTRRNSTIGIGRLSLAKPTTETAAKISAFVRKF